ncbi:alpha/beta fold hydrolase [Nocardia sp. NPDC057272]|uniref:alpha/beta fold hydrolase n=1 Tax=Nocardia sp. NPDC057272 TaxID=3346079 RepID=UPI00363973A0
MSVVSELGESRLVHLPQGTIRIYERGQGEPVLFVHGLFANAAAWRKVVPRLADSYRCITADWPFGAHRIPMTPDADLTPLGIAETIADVIETVDLDAVTLVGNDGGGMLSQLVVTHRPERIARLVLTPCDAYENFPPPLFDYLCWMARTPGAGSLTGLLLRFPTVRQTYARSRFGFGGLSNNPICGELIDHYLHGMTHDRAIVRDSLKFLRAVDNKYTLDAAARFRSATLPVLIAWAEQDRFFPFEHARRLAEDFPNARLASITNSLTWVAEDQPARTAAVIDQFIGTTPLHADRPS